MSLICRVRPKIVQAMGRRRSRFGDASNVRATSLPVIPNSDVSIGENQAACQTNEWNPSSAQAANFVIAPHRNRAPPKRRRVSFFEDLNQNASNDGSEEESDILPRKTSRSLPILANKTKSRDLADGNPGRTGSNVNGVSAAVSSDPNIFDASPEPCIAYENDLDSLDAFMKGIASEAAEAATWQRPEAFSGEVNDNDIEGDLEMSADAQDSADGEGFLERSKRKRLVYEKINHSLINYSPFQRDLYREVPELARMSQADTTEVRRALGNIRIRGKRCPKPIRSFGQCGLSSAILDVIGRAGFTAPTPIQAQAIPCIMSGRDVIGIAKTGSGKTLAFMLPVMRHVLLQERPVAGEGPIGLLIAPTRELAIQIYGEAKRFARAVGLRCVCAYGGSGVKDQIAELKRGADIVICTPGRMIDLLAMNSGRITNLRRVTIVVLDEADRMFDMGFEPQLTRLVENVRPDRQTVMFSATFPMQVERLARKVLSHPVEIVVGGRSVAASSIEQHIEVRSEESKFLRLLQLLGVWYEKGSILIFVDRQENADRIFRELSQTGYLCLPLHGGMDQADRDSAVADFKNGDIRVLVATSVAARGLDVKQLSLVVNFDVPNHYEDYVHRVGRTGRAGQKGTAYTFITPEQDIFAGDMIKALQLSARAAIITDGLSTEDAKRVEEEAARAAVPEALQNLADTFKERQDAKRSAGIVVHNVNSGYGGRGFTFDENEEDARLAFRKSQAKRYKAEADGPDVGDESESDGDDVVEHDDIQIKIVERSKASTSSAGICSSTLTKPPSLDASHTFKDCRMNIGVESDTMEDGPFSSHEVKDMIHAAEEQAKLESKEKGLNPADTTARIVAAKAEVLTLVDSRNRGRRPEGLQEIPRKLETIVAADESAALSAAAAAAAALSAKLGKGQDAPTGSSASGAGASGQDGKMEQERPGSLAAAALNSAERSFEAEMEINDYPQHARWKVTHANALNDVTENTGCVVTARGNYYPPGRNPPNGERKLHLLIEGENERAVKAAWRDIRLKLEEAATSRPMEKGLAYSKYSVV